MTNNITSSSNSIEKLQSNALAQLAKAMSDAGLPCNELSAETGYHRYSSRGARDKAEWYEIFYVGDDLCAEFGTWRPIGPFKVEFYSNPNAQVDPSYMTKVRVVTKEIEAQRKIKAEETAAIWKGRIDSAPSADPKHPYLVKKKVGAHGIKQHGEALQIPIYGEDGELLSVQMIMPDGEKRFAEGCSRLRGRFYLGDPNAAKDIYVAEGYATGASVYEALDKKCCVAIAFSAKDCNPVGISIEVEFPEKKVILLQDLGYAGELAAFAWREFVNPNVMTPKFNGAEGKDWNDLATVNKAEVKRQLTEVPTLPFVTTKAFLKIHRPPSPALWESLFREGSTNMIYGNSGSMKTIIAEDVALSVSLGRDCWGFKTKQARTFYLDAELPENLIEARLRHSVARYGLSEMPENLLFCTKEMMNKSFSINLLTTDSRERLAKTIIDNGFKFVILDAISFLTTWFGTDINDYKDEPSIWKQIFDWLFSLNSQGITILFISHTLKSGEVLKGCSDQTLFLETIIKTERINKDVYQKMPLAERSMYGWPIQLEYEKNRNYTDWERLPKTVRLLRDADAQMPPTLVSSCGWGLSLRYLTLGNFAFS